MSDNWGVCIGIDHYTNLQSLSFAKRDADAVKTFLENEIGFKTVYYFAEDAPDIVGDSGPAINAKPTFANLMRFLRVRFDEPFLKPSDNFWFFFAGHGRRERDQDFLLPSDIDPGNVFGTGIAVSHISARLRRSGAGNVILFLDACRSEGARDGEGIGLETQKGVVTVCSCGPAERSYEVDELKHGVFTYGLLEALRTSGENNCCTVERLDNYLRYRVPEICTRYGRPRQTPYTNAEPMSKRHLILLSRVASPEDLEPLKLDALQAEAMGDLSLAEQLWWRVNAVDPNDAQVHEAVKRITIKLGEIRPQRDSEHDIVTRFNRIAEYAQTRNPVRRHLLQGAGAGALMIAAGLGFPFLFPGRSIKQEMETKEVKTVFVNDDGQIIDSVSRMIECLTIQFESKQKILFEFSVIPEGFYQVGSPEDEIMRSAAEGPQHWVKIKRFGMGRMPVTQAQWRAVLAEAPAKVDRPLPTVPSFFDGETLPVETISWNDAIEFVKRLSKLFGLRIRLPSEAEWECACRAQTTTPFHFGATITPELANYCGSGGATCGNANGKSVASSTYNGIVCETGAYASGPPGTFRGGTSPVGSFPPNAFGLFDMHGNVWEHCLDTWRSSYSHGLSEGAPFTNENTELRVLRGGSWSHHPTFCRSSYRDSMRPDFVGWQGRVGFRIVCEV